MANIVTTTSPKWLGGLSIPWGEIRELLPDERWAVWACGWTLCPGGFTLQLAVQNGDGTGVVLGGQTFAAMPTYTKVQIGPYAARGPLAPALVNQAEAIQHIGMVGSVATDGQVLHLNRWTLWLRMTPRST